MVDAPPLQLVLRDKLLVLLAAVAVRGGHHGDALAVADGRLVGVAPRESPPGLELEGDGRGGGDRGRVAEQLEDGAVGGDRAVGAT